jgi:L-2,4-diaminobutyrate decarboxylase
MTISEVPDSSRLRDAFDPEHFRRDGHALVDRLADYLTEPRTMLDNWPADFPAESHDDLLDIAARVIAESNHLHNPRYMGHQVTAPLPIGALCDLVASVLNNGMAIYEHGPSGTAMELHVVQWMARSLGWAKGAGGLLTSGGSVGNLTALLAMRQARAGGSVWKDGADQGPPLAVMASQHVHYSVERALRVMGWGDAGLVTVPVDADLRMRPETLEGTYQRAGDEGRRIIAVVANACCTPTGAYDPLEPIADFCEAHGLWLHVDGAHGASVCLSDKYRHLVAGIDRADSVVWDAHKMLMLPALCTAVLFRDGAHAYDAFAQDAFYLFGAEPRDEWYNMGHRTIECTKRMLSLKLYAALRCHGTQVFAEYVTRAYDLAQCFAGLIRDAPDFQLGADPQSNIICFRYTPDGVDDLDALQAAIRRRLLEDGTFYIVQTRLPTGLHLRTALMNPFTSPTDVEQLLATIRTLSKSVNT